MAKPTKLPSGNWRIRILDYTDADKKKHYKSFTAPTKKEVMYMAAEYSLNKKDDTYEDLILSEAYDRYIDSKSAVLSPSTIREYKRAKDRDFQKLMGMKIKKITPELVQTAVNEAAAIYSPKTVRCKHGLLHSVLKAYYPTLTLQTRLPQKTIPEYYIPTTADIQKLLSLASDRIRVPILLASSASLRRSEISALTLDDVTDLGVQINKAKVLNENKEWVVKPPKTNAGYRFIPLSSDIIKEVRAWKYFGCTPESIGKSFANLVKKSGIPYISFHKLRHYFASELHAQGVPDQYIAKLGGWDSMEVLHNIYQHTLKDKESLYNNKTVNIMNKLLQKDDTKDDTKKIKA